jgi:hypothetical protein
VQSRFTDGFHRRGGEYAEDFSAIICVFSLRPGGEIPKQRAPEHYAQKKS